MPDCEFCNKEITSFHIVGNNDSEHGECRKEYVNRLNNGRCVACNKPRIKYTRFCDSCYNDFTITYVGYPYP